jgi:hypothetical protein
VSFPAGGTIFIGRDVQFEARETMSDGTMRAATNAVWGSEAPAVASVSATGVVRGVSPGEATIFADAGTRGALRIRVYPNFGGTWRGSEVVTGCEDSGALAGVCSEFRPGAVFGHLSSFTQTDAAVNAEIDGGDGTTARMSGTITVGGDLPLPTAPLLPADPVVNIQIQNWQSRSDVPAVMTGTLEYFVTAPGLPGSVRAGTRLQDVVRASAQSASTQMQSTPGAALAERIRRRIRNPHGGL